MLESYLPVLEKADNNMLYCLPLQNVRTALPQNENMCTVLYSLYLNDSKVCSNLCILKYYAGVYFNTTKIRVLTI